MAKQTTYPTKTQSLGPKNLWTRHQKDFPHYISCTLNTHLSRITGIFCIDQIQRWEKINIHGCIYTMTQFIHVILAKILQNKSKKEHKINSTTVPSLVLPNITLIQTCKTDTYHVYKASIHLCHSILKTSNNSKFLLWI